MPSIHHIVAKILINDKELEIITNVPMIQKI